MLEHRQVEETPQMVQEVNGRLKKENEDEIPRKFPEYGFASIFIFNTGTANLPGNYCRATKEGGEEEIKKCNPEGTDKKRKIAATDQSGTG